MMYEPNLGGGRRQVHKQQHSPSHTTSTSPPSPHQRSKTKCSINHSNTQPLNHSTTQPLIHSVLSVLSIRLFIFNTLRPHPEQKKPHRSKPKSTLLKDSRQENPFLRNKISREIEKKGGNLLSVFFFLSLCFLSCYK